MASFVPQQEIQQTRALAEQVTITPDFASFVADVAIGLPSDELAARLNAKDGFAITPDGENFYGRDGYRLKEKRGTTGQEKEVLLADQRYRSAIIERGQQADDFLDIGEDILSGGGQAITQRDELAARLNAKDGFAITPDGENFYGRDGYRLREKRGTSQPQSSALLELFALRSEASTLNDGLENFASFYQDIDDGTLSGRDELAARLNAKDGLAITPDGENFYGRDGYRLREKRVVEAVDGSLLRNDLEAIDEIAAASENAAGYDGFFTDILSGRIPTSDELAARLNAKDGLAITPDGENFYGRGGYRVKESRRVDEEQAKKLARSAALLRAAGRYGRDLSEELLGGGDGNELLVRIDADFAQSMVASDAAAMTAERNAVTEIAREWRRCKVDAEVLATIVRTRGDIDQVFALVRDDIEEDIVDRQRAERLSALCLQRRRVDFSASIIEQLSDTSVNIDAVLERLRDFAESPDPADKERALVLTRYAYRTEIVREQARLSSVLLAASRDPVEYQAELAASRLRPSVTGFDYAGAIDTRNQRLEQVATEVFNAGKDQETVFIYRNFETADAAQILEMISDVANRYQDDESAQALLEYYKLYLTNRREARREDYETVFSFEVEAVRKAILPQYDFDQGLGNNLPAAKELAKSFTDVILPLFQSLQGESSYQSLVESYINGESGTHDARTRYQINVQRLAEQRELTDIERTYLASVEALSAFNPYLVAVANANPGLAFAYLESYFSQLSNDTYSEYFADDGETPYFPLVSLGLGPNGVTGLGEVMRSRPDLIGNTFVLDALNIPSGPFGVPNGAAWGLNSAKAVGLGNYILPDAASEDLAGKRVRDYVGIRWYPGERPADADTRPGSINTLVDYLPSPDAISDGRYNDNEDLSLLAQLQAAMLVRNAQFKSMLLDIEPAPAGSNGKWRVWFQTRDAEGQVQVKKVDTDGFIGAFGLGKEYYGFNLEGSRAQGVLDTQDESAFPKLAPTLKAFKSLANRETESPIPGEVIAIYGKGNSTDTLVEYLGGLFKGNNPVVRNVRKIYVIAEGGLSKRPRYAGNSDLFGRNGRDSIVEFVEARVGDIDYTDPDNPTGTMRLFNSDGNVIANAQGIELAPDHVIAATGFRPELTTLLRGTGAVQETAGGPRLVTKPVTLPTNPTVPVADTVGDNGDILITGVASDSGFDRPAKLQQLPDLAREALLRNGVENAVAIGFRAPDTQAAVRLWLEQRPNLGRQQTGTATTQPNSSRVLVNASETVAAETVIELNDLISTDNLPAVRNDVLSGSETLTPLLLRNLAKVKLTSTGGEKFANYGLRLSLNGSATLTTMGDVPTGILNLVTKAARDPYFQTYARNALKRRRGSKSIDISLAFSNGRLVFKDSYAQAA